MCGVGLMVGSCLVAAPANPPAKQPPPKPNMVLVVADDLGWRDVGCFGGPNVKTPHIDRLAAEGMRFTNAYTASPVCGPTRAQLYGGRYPVNSGSYFNHPRHYIRAGVKTLPAALKELGYRVGIVGKIDAGPTEAYPFELLAQGKDTLLGDGVRDFVARDPAQPFCLVIGSHNPHSPWSRNAEGLDAATLAVPPQLVDTPETRTALLLYYGKVQALDRDVGECLKLLEESGHANALVLFTSEQGSEFPFGKGTLFDHGMKLAVVARWPGRVKPGGVCDAIIQHIDFPATLVDAAGGAPDPGWDGKSFVPMLEGRVVENHEFAYGCYADQRAIRTKRFKYIRNLDPGTLKKDGPSPFNTGAMASDPANKFYPNWSHPKSWLPLAGKDAAVARKIEWFRQRPPEDLFDIGKDPFELNNVATNIEYAEALAGLRAKCDGIMAAQGDKGMATASELARWNDGEHRAGKGYFGSSTGPTNFPGKNHKDGGGK